MSATIRSLHIAPQAGEPMASVASAQLEAGRGVVGDRYYQEQGTFSEKLKGRPDKEVTLIEAEQIDAFNRLNAIALDAGQFRRNVVTEGIALNDLVGKRFMLGDCELEGIRLCEPCTHLAKMLGPHILEQLAHKAGLRARIVSSGTVAPGAAVHELEN